MVDSFQQQQPGFIVRPGLVYLSSPYSHSDFWVRQRRFELALDALRSLVRRRVSVFSPVVHTHHLVIPEFTNDDWLLVDEPLLAVSSAVYVLCIDGWSESRGVSWEIGFAHSRGVVVKYLVYESGDWVVRDEPGESLSLSSWVGRRLLSLSDYQRCCGETAIYPSVGDMTTYPLLGLAGEVGELLNKAKKMWRDGVGVLAGVCGDASKLAELSEELGDVLWYVARLASELGLDLGEVAFGNMVKLLDRRRRGVLGGSGDRR